MIILYLFPCYKKTFCGYNHFFILLFHGVGENKKKFYEYFNVNIFQPITDNVAIDKKNQAYHESVLHRHLV